MRLQFFAIIVLSILAAMIYGIIHDQITARVCIEYFTVGHPPIFRTNDPTLLAIGWGIVATWWVGLLLGVPLAAAARAGSRPRRSAGSLVRPVGWLMAATALSALAAGILGWWLAQRGDLSLVGELAHRVPADRHVPFLADVWAHSASYVVGGMGGIVLMAFVWRARETSAINKTQ